jgi:hypothetical protein
MNVQDDTTVADSIRIIACMVLILAAFIGAWKLIAGAGIGVLIVKGV